MSSKHSFLWTAAKFYTVYARKKFRERHFHPHFEDYDTSVNLFSCYLLYRHLGTNSHRWEGEERLGFVAPMCLLALGWCSHTSARYLERADGDVTCVYIIIGVWIVFQWGVLLVMGDEGDLWANTLKVSAITREDFLSIASRSWA